MNNPLLQEFSSQFETAPFSKIKAAHFEPAIKTSIQQAREEIELIVSNTAIPTFENTLEALEFSGQQLDRITSIFFNLNSAETNTAIQEIARKIAPILSDFNNDIILNEKLFQKIKYVFDHRVQWNLTPEQETLLTKKYKNFYRNGANLNQKDKAILRKIDTQLADLKLNFSKNVLKETQNFELHITDTKELEGLPEGAIEAAKQEAVQKQKEGWVFTLDYPSYHAIMTYSKHRYLREKMARAYGKRGFQNNAYNNEKIILSITKLRNQRAQLLGYKSHADFVLEERMAETPKKVFQFLDDLLEKSLPFAQKEFQILKEFAQKEGVADLQIWDGTYFTEKLKKSKFELDDEALKPYFKLENVVQGAFDIAQKLYGLSFVKNREIDTYHSDVTAYEVYDANQKFMAVFYTDFFPRSGKRNGAWMTSYKNQWIKDGKNSRPHISIVCNFTKPTRTKPSLLSFREVTTLFHEFGHALHGMLANTTYPSLSGTNVYWDFVELPSQLMENWAYEKEALALFATHYQTGDLIPQKYIDKIKESSNFMEGMATLRQLSFGFLDMAWHAKSTLAVSSVKAYEKKAFQKTQLYPDIEENCMSTAFSHIFPGGYSAGYYSYKWAEVLDADAFEYFKEKGIFNKEIAGKFQKNVLSQGGTEKPMTLYKRFRGKEPQVDALLKRAGLIH